MNRCCWFILVSILFSPPVLAADEGIPEKKLEALKAAAVYVKVEGRQGTITGSGFLIHVDGETGLVATNRHVVAGIPGLFTPKQFLLVFWSGTRKEQVLSGQVVAMDTDRDLAILKVTATNLPAPLDLSPIKLRETMTIYTLGFPLGNFLAPNPINPGVTIGKGTIASLPEDNRGRLRHIQFDGELNPGNSGGPVVDGDGKLVGIAAAKIMGTRISFAIPSAELIDMFKGRAAPAVLRGVRIDNNSAELEVEVPLIDPLHKIKTVEIRHVRKDSLKELPQADKAGNWPDLPGAETVAVKIENGKAIARITLRSAEKKSFDYCFQTAYTIGDGKPVSTQPVMLKIDFAQVGVFRFDGVLSWQTITSKEGGFTIEMPVRPIVNGFTVERIAGMTMKSLLLGCGTENGTYLAYRLDMPGMLPRGSEERFLDTLRDFFVEQWNGKVTSEKKIRSQGNSGRDFTIRGKLDDNTFSNIHMRQYMVGQSIFVVVVISPPNTDLPEDAGRFLDSFTLNGIRNRVVVPEPELKGTELKGWGMAIDPDKDCKIIPDGKSITIQVPDTVHDLHFETGQTNAPRVMREVEGDFVVTVKVCGEFKPGPKSTNPKTIPVHDGGILLWSDSNNNIRFERFSWRRGDKIQTGAYFEEREGGRKSVEFAAQFPAGDCYLRIERKGNRIVSTTSSDGTNWKEVKAVDIDWPSKIKVGLVAINTSNEPFSVKFEEFELK